MHSCQVFPAAAQAAHDAAGKNAMAAPSLHQWSFELGGPCGAGRIGEVRPSIEITRRES